MSDTIAPIPAGVLFSRAMRLACPVCGKGRPFPSWFKTERCCDACGYLYEREPGYFLGSIYFNYGLTGAVSMVAFFVTEIWMDVSDVVQMTPIIGFCIVFPCWFFRYSRSLFMALDVGFDPPELREFERKGPATP